MDKGLWFWVYASCDDVDFSNKIEDNRLLISKIEKENNEMATKLWKYIIINGDCDGMESQY